MNQNAENLIVALEPSIHAKCEALKAQRKKKTENRLFLLVCLMVLIMPVLMLLGGVSLTVFIAPVIFMSFGTVLLLPILLKREPMHEEV